MRVMDTQVWGTKRQANAPNLRIKFLRKSAKKNRIEFI
jgi:hypothetical protein